MTLDNLIRKMDHILMKMDNNKLKLFVVGVPLVFSSLGTYFTIEYASKGELGEATIAGICTLLNAYYAGYQHKSIDSRDNSSCHF